MAYYAVIALVRVDDSLTHDAVYDLVDQAFKDIDDELLVQYRDVDPNWEQFQVLRENADIEEEI